MPQQGPPGRAKGVIKRPAAANDSKDDKKKPGSFMSVLYAKRGLEGAYVVRAATRGGLQFAEVNVPNASREQNYKIATAVCAELNNIGSPDSACVLLRILTESLTNELASARLGLPTTGSSTAAGSADAPPTAGSSTPAPGSADPAPLPKTSFGPRTTSASGPTSSTAPTPGGCYPSIRMAPAWPS